jgi:uncharacterized protein (TIGR02271 family)
MARQTLVAYFDSRSEADNAADALVAAGLNRDTIHLNADGGIATATTGGAGGTHKGFWESIADFFMPDDDRYAYDEGVRRGGATLVVSADEARVDEVAEILERHGAADMDERESSWRSEGWEGAPAVPTTGGPVVAPDLAASAAASSASAADARAGMSDVEAIPLAEEQLRVGKRQASGGRVRVRSYVVETPVEEQISLREENVSVTTRAVDRSAKAADEGLFRERTIEAEEVNEEAVVAKEARVKEEVVVSKDVGQRTETVRDTVRHTEVEVDDTRTSTPRPAR